MLIVNCSYEPADLSNYLKNNSVPKDSTVILDFASAFSKENEFRVKYPSDIDLKNEAHRSALAEYITQMGKFSRSEINGGTVRSVTFNSLPLYWLTEISEKHPRTSLVKKLYYFKHLYPLLNYQGNEIAFVLPSDAPHFISAINKFIQDNLKQIKNTFFNLSEPGVAGLKQHRNNVISFLKKMIFIKKQVKNIEVKNSEDPDTLIFTYFPQTWRDELNGDYVLKEIANYSSASNKRVLYPVFFFDHYDLKGISLRKNWDPAFFKAFPSYSQVLKFHIDLFFLFFSLKKVKLKGDPIDFLDNKVLQHELHNVLRNKKEYLFNYTWFTNYFKKQSRPVKLFYQDEFYASGRMISAAAANAGNPNVKTYGVQHGAFYEAHTVYSITDEEINDAEKGDGLPMPGKFIVWGNYFKRHFLKNNSKAPEFIIPAGNPNYTSLKLGTGSRPGSETLTKILWCTTNKIDVINQYKKIISGFLTENKNAVIIVRCHPQFNYTSFINDELKGKEFGDRIMYSEIKNIYDDIINSDVVLSSSGSTIFIDAMICNKPVLKLVNEDYYMGDLGEKEMINVYSDADLLREVKNLSSESYTPVKYSDLVNTDPSEWIKLFN